MGDLRVFPAPGLFRSVAALRFATATHPRKFSTETEKETGVALLKTSGGSRLRGMGKLRLPVSGQPQSLKHGQIPACRDPCDPCSWFSTEQDETEKGPESFLGMTTTRPALAGVIVDERDFGPSWIVTETSYPKLCGPAGRRHGTGSPVAGRSPTCQIATSRRPLCPVDQSTD